MTIRAKELLSKKSICLSDVTQYDNFDAKYHGNLVLKYFEHCLQDGIINMYAANTSITFRLRIAHLYDGI